MEKEREEAGQGIQTAVLAQSGWPDFCLLILDPVSGPLIEKMKSECSKFEKQHGIKVNICSRAGKSVRSDARPEPLRKPGCERVECMSCQTAGGKKGDCEKNSVTYQICCETCLRAVKVTTYDAL